MPIIKSQNKIEKEQVRINIEKNIINNIRQYCQWAGVKKTDEFFVQAAEYILSKDIDWLNYINQKTAL